MLKKLIIYSSKKIVPLFYNKKYLKGRYFDDLNGGWLWGIQGILWQKIFGFNRHIPWPTNPFITVQNPKNIIFDINDLGNFHSPGCYYQNNHGGKIYIGKGTCIAPNVGIITCNHDINNLKKHLQPRDIIIGENCWIGMNSVILPGVKLGNKVIVGAGSVVTKNFEEGNCIIAGSPAKIIKKIDDKNE